MTATGLIAPAERRSIVSEVDDLAARAEALVADLDGPTLDVDLARQLVKRFSRIERIAAAGGSIAARRVADSDSWTRNGDRSPAHWMARETGVSVGAASAALDTSAQLDRLPALDGAVRSGEVSQAQAKEIAAAATVDPGAERSLLNAAGTTSLAGLREECAKVRAAAVPDETEQHRRIHRTRRFRHWTDADGAFAFAGRTTADRGALLLAAMKPQQDRIFNEARRQERRESQDAYAMDALIALAETAPARASVSAPAPAPSVEPASTPALPASRTCELPCEEGMHPQRSTSMNIDDCRSARNGCACDSRVDAPQPEGELALEAERGATATPRRPKALVHVRVDHAALVRGRTEPGETCEIAGIGPVPVATAKQMMNDAFLAAIVTDGVDVKTVAHMGRTIPAHLRTALMERDPQCRVPGCTATEHLEIDHVVPFAEGGPTRLDNLVRLCSFHHDQKTYGGYQLTGQPEHPTWTKVEPSRNNPYRRAQAVSDRSPP